ncbi:MgtC/SapB family protein [bacterium]|nr:MgtC/SapB family protein [bacterium]NCQ54775.1 MgtC/SapB family protein [Candidatus Parcubacteria bacterium]NCS68028.1 MgtC/SapB family protein [Candidatus Peregrinibacteria bacterium]NCS95765.1 MgtC/SapB family protein [bacterium]
MKDWFTLLTPENTIYQLILAAALGAFVGLRREIDNNKQKHAVFMGFRTMALMSTLGVISTFFEPMPYLPAVCFGGLLTFLAIAYANGAFKLKLVGMTSEISALVMFWIGVLVGYEEQILAIILTIFIGGLNAFKDELHRFAGTISDKEWLGALQLLIVSGAVLPFLPRDPIDPLGMIVPFNIWFLVIMISGIGFMGYFLTKYIGVRGSVALTAFLGSIVSSTAVTTSMADQSKRAKLTGIFTVGVLVAVATMQIRVAIEIVAWGTPEMAKSLIAIPLSMAVAAAAMAGYFFWKTNQKHKFNEPNISAPTTDVELVSPFELGPALKFGGVFVLVLLALAFGQKYFGDSGVYAAAFFSGAVDVDAIVLSSLESVKLGEMEPILAERAILIAVAVNNLVKILYVAVLGNRRMVGKVGVGILVTTSVGVLTWLVW